MSANTLTLQRFNGDEVFAVSTAVINYFVGDENTVVAFEVYAEGKPLTVTPPDLEGSGGRPNAEWQLTVPAFDPEDLAGKSFRIPAGYDDEALEYVAIFYYFDHVRMDDSKITFLERDADKYRVQINAATEDPNYGAGKPPTRIEIEAEFTLTKSEKPLPKMG